MDNSPPRRTCWFLWSRLKATENELRCLVERQPIVCPTIHGAKSEDTLLTTHNDQSPEILTETGAWVYYDVAVDGAKIRRPMILEK